MNGNIRRLKALSQVHRSYFHTFTLFVHSFAPLHTRRGEQETHVRRITLPVLSSPPLALSCAHLLAHDLLNCSAEERVIERGRQRGRELDLTFCQLRLLLNRYTVTVPFKILSREQGHAEFSSREKKIKRKCSALGPFAKQVPLYATVA